ncbi:hypothetical protein LTR53_000564 [Teratosphaeriaceae sp. CCFEE 6253]|nr:hypothetical protein LTR53_000564 [Teratosphaeriaceae sp. CCFEE 6253]
MDTPSPGSLGEAGYPPSLGSRDGGFTSASADSPPTSASSSPGTDQLARSSMSVEAAAFFSGHTNYLPLGCLVLEDDPLSPPDPNPKAPQWRDISSVHRGLGLDAVPSDRINKLAHAGWLRIQSARSMSDQCLTILRLYILPGDVGHRFVDRHDNKLWSSLQSLVAEVDVNPEVWEGRCTPGTVRQKFDVWATSEQSSLFYLFNTLPSPSPCPKMVKEKYAHEALEDLLDPASVLPGLKTVLYPYQRRSAGQMLQREAVPQLTLDPRLEQRQAPDGSTYYYSARDLLFLRQPRYYEACRGGILAETMGLGKTVMLLAVILASKHHAPGMPPAYSALPVRAKTAKLSEMAVSAINRHSIPWRVEFDRIQHATGNDMASCVQLLSDSPPMYEIPREPQRWNRKTILPPPKQMTLATTTIIVVPRNLCKQWQSEINKHIEAGALRVLVMEDLKRALPPPAELRGYDVVLFSRNRFEMEIRDGSDEQGRRIAATQLVCRCPYVGATRVRNCQCIRSEELYDSPLKHLHFKRLVIDEGHFFGHRSNSTAVTVANKLVTADHRWVVSGTPAKDLMGVEVDVSMAEKTSVTSLSRDALLDQRRAFSEKEDIAGAVKSLGVLATTFLKIRPWSAEGTSERRGAEWDEHIYRHEDTRKRTYSGFSTGLRRTLEAMVVKTQPDDVDRDIELPPLSHEVVRLEPSFYDKVTANLFTLVLTANAVTSERTDVDYLFHKNSAKPRYQLVQNLRQSAFFWTGFSVDDIEASIGNSRRYLEKQDANCSSEDRRVLSEMLLCADKILASHGWKAMTRSHELGLFVDGWPAESEEHWSFDGSYTPLLTGVSQLLEAQKHVNERAGTQDPGEGLAGVGIRALAPARHGTVKQELVERPRKKRKVEKSILTKAGIPTSGEPILKRRASLVAKANRVSPKQGKLTCDFKVTKVQKRTGLDRTTSSPAKLEDVDCQESSPSVKTSSPTATAQSTRKRRRSELEAVEFPPDSPYLRSRIVGTASAKLSYLVSQILKYQQDEKILVFYEGDNIAYYIAQALELLHVPHNIYAKSLSAPLKSEYVVRFDQEARDRVLLMDVKQAAFGLNLSSASRIYFVNPVCRPNIEAQAIKRAHRIGQTRKVYVETLVLRGTIEEAMLERAQRMTRSEHADAKALEDDGGIKHILQNARMLPLLEHERSQSDHIARLETEQQLWGREGWRDTVVGARVHARTTTEKRRRTISFEDITREDEDAKLVVHDDSIKLGPNQRVLSFVDCTKFNDDGYVQASSDEEPMIGRWQRTSSSSGHMMSQGRMRQDSIIPSPMEGNQLADNHPSPVVMPRVPQETATGFRRLSIGRLLNDEHANIATQSVTQGTTDLLHEIVRRL